MVVLDTTVASFIYNRDPRGSHYGQHLRGEILVIACQTRAELIRGSRAASWGVRRSKDLVEFCGRFVLHEAGQSTADLWAELMDQSRRNGRMLSTQDAWVAATARELDATLLTHDQDFDQTSCPGLRIIRYSDTGVLSP